MIAIDEASRTLVAMKGAALGRDTIQITPSRPKPKALSVSLARGIHLIEPVDRVDEDGPDRRIDDQRDDHPQTDPHDQADERDERDRGDGPEELDDGAGGGADPG
jgi:hypothetical protein